MKIKLLLSLLIVALSWSLSCSQNNQAAFSANLKVSEELKDQLNSEGRLFLFLSKNMEAEPRTQTWPSPINKTFIFAKNISGLQANDIQSITSDDSWMSTADWTLDEVPAGDYKIQILWDQDISESRIDAPGNLYSESQILTIEKTTTVDMTLSQVIPDIKVTEHQLSRVVELKSEILSAWWGKPVHLKASVLLPHNYDGSKAYPIRYNVAGYGGRYTRINYLLNNEQAMDWLDSEDSPQIISVFLDGEGPYGDSYQLDSDNSGPYGEALITEFIPYIESKYRGTNTADTRFVDGCSTGGWVSLALQLYYPDFFNGVYSYSPDAIDFENYQLINIYTDQNAYVNEHGYPRPVMRSTDGEPMLSMEEFIQYENVLGPSDNYLTSGGQFSAHTALYSPKGSDGLPKPLFDPVTGQIEASVAEHWKKYDLKWYTEQNWQELGPKLQDKIFIWMGDMDNFYLNPATRTFSEFLSQTENPKSDATVEFAAMEGHCSQYSYLEVLNKIQEKIESRTKN